MVAFRLRAISTLYLKVNFLGAPYSHDTCVDEDHAQKLEFFHSYSQPACKMECLTQYVLQQCDCRMFYMPGTVILQQK